MSSTTAARSANPRAPLRVALAAWAVSALVLVVLAPLRGSALTTFVAFASVVLVPGLLVGILLKLHPSWRSPWVGFTMSLALGSGIAIPVAWLTRSLGLPLEYGSFALTGIGFGLLLAIGMQSRRRGVPGFDGLAGRRPGERAADITVLLGGALLALIYQEYVQPAMKSGDLWVYLSYIDWMVERPGFEYLPHSASAEELSPRLTTSGFLALEALLTRVLRADANALQLFWSWLPITLLPAALFALYSLAVVLGTDARTRIVLVLVQLAIVYATYGYLQDRTSSAYRWPGITWFTRSAQDKVFLFLQLVPAAALLGVGWLEAGERRSLAALGIVGVACVFTHPLGLPFIMVVCVPYAALSAVVGAAEWRRVAALVAVLIPLVAWPLMQRGAESAPNTIADEAGFDRRVHLTRDSLDIESREDNQYTAHVSLISHPLLIAGIAAGGILGLAARRRRDARYAFATTLATMSMLYLPVVTPMVGLVVTPYLLWRFTWLLPLALSLAALVSVAAELAARLFSRSFAQQGSRVREVVALVFVVALGVATRLPQDIAHTSRVLTERKHSQLDARATQRVAEMLQTHAGDEAVVLMEARVHRIAVGLADGIQTIYWRAREQPELHARVAGLFASSFVADDHLELLREFDVDWIALREEGPIWRDLDRRTDAFALVQALEGVRLYRVLELANVTAPKNLVEYWRGRVRDEPGSAEVLGGLAAALIGSGSMDEARGVLELALELDEPNSDTHGSLGMVLLLVRSDRAAIRHLKRALELRPDLEDTPSSLVNNLAWILATTAQEGLRDPPRLRELVDVLIGFEPRDEEILDTIAAGLAALGDFEGAVNYQQKAIDLVEPVIEDGSVEGAAARAVAAMRQRQATFALGRVLVIGPAN